MSVQLTLCCGNAQLNFRRVDQDAPEEVGMRIVLGHLPGDKVGYELRRDDNTPIRALTAEESLVANRAFAMLAGIIGEK